MGQHLLGFAAQQQTLDAFASMGGHDDQIGFVFLGSSDEGIGHNIGLDDHRLDGNTFGASGFGHGVQTCFGSIGPLLLDFGDFLGAQWNAAFKVGLRIAGHDLDRDQRCATSSGQGNGAGNGFFGQTGTIGGDQNAFVPGNLL